MYFGLELDPQVVRSWRVHHLYPWPGAQRLVLDWGARIIDRVSILSETNSLHLKSKGLKDEFTSTKEAGKCHVSFQEKCHSITEVPPPPGLPPNFASLLPLAWHIKVD